MNFKDYRESINEFYRQNGMAIDPLPNIELVKDKIDKFDPFIDTGNFCASTNTLKLFINNRQVKDVLRTYCHELVHVHQYHSNPERFSLGDSDLNNPETEKLEEEAYLSGNILFRKWTVEYSKNSNVISETAEKPFKKTSTVIVATMRPPHKGHLEMIEEYAKKSEQVIVAIPEKDERKTINGKDIPATVAKQILEKYLQKYDLDKKVTIEIVNEKSPAKCAIEVISKKLSDTNVILGLGSDKEYSRYAGVIENFKDRDDLYIFDPATTIAKPKSNVSAEDFRNNINDFDYVKGLIPDKFSDTEKQNLITFIDNSIDTNTEDTSNEINAIINKQSKSNKLDENCTIEFFKK